MDWALLVASISAMAESISAGVGFYEMLQKHKSDPKLPQKAAILREALSTYSEDEVESIQDNLNHCQEQFKATGNGPGRVQCFCFVLRNVKDGNGGTMPDIDNWQAVYEQLGCEN
jgi:hypothetical protein